MNNNILTTITTLPPYTYLAYATPLSIFTHIYSHLYMVAAVVVVVKVVRTEDANA